MDTDAAIVRRAIDGDERAMRLLWNQHAPHVDAIVAGSPAIPTSPRTSRRRSGSRSSGRSRRGGGIRSSARGSIGWRSTARSTRCDASGQAAAEAPIEEHTAVVSRKRRRPCWRQSIEEACTQLSPGARTVFLLHDVEGYTHEEIAEELGITPGGSKSQLFKARAKLRRLLAPLLDTPDDTVERSYAAP
jgi:RNA polymerase sigma-70 factor, ECF subfamily